jgi:hypothetical protein
MLDFRPYLRRPMATIASVATDPVEAWIRLREQLAAQFEGSTPPDLYQRDDDWQNHLCQLIDLDYPDTIISEFWDLWHIVIEELEAKGIRAGPESFKGWNDGDAAFVRAVWFLTRHLRPRNVIETGVAHGVTSRFILEALERNARGHLWSIDRPPMEREWHQQIGVAVNSSLRHRWSYVLGSSRRRLPSLLTQLGTVDLFVHDSLHSARNVRFEMDSVWAALTPGGVIVVDDIDVNRGFSSFTEHWHGDPAIVCEAEPLRPDLRRFNRKGLFGMVVKQAQRKEYSPADPN